MLIQIGRHQFNPAKIRRTDRQSGRRAGLPIIELAIYLSDLTTPEIVLRDAEIELYDLGMKQFVVCPTILDNNGSAPQTRE